MDLFTYVSVFPDTCSVPWKGRKDCGYGGITPAQCFEKGCCVDSTIDGTLAPHCFFSQIGKLSISDF